MQGQGSVVLLCPFKNYTFACYSPMGLINASPAGYKSKVIWGGGHLSSAAVKPGVPHVQLFPERCGNIVLLLGRAGGRKRQKCPPVLLGSLEDHRQSLDA